MKNLTWQNPEQLFVAQVLINKVKSKCCGIKDIKKAMSFAKSSELNDNSIRPIRNATLYCTKRNCLVLDFMRHLRNSFCHALLKKGGKSVSIIR